jgi:hypothetical protein
MDKDIGVLLVDLKKAFDLVNHELLLKKLELYKCSERCLNLFRSYLSDRLQFTLFQGCISESAEISVGVPQGSILGPLLFLVYINDLHLITQNSCHMFADDSTFYTSAKSIDEVESNLSDDLLNISNWCTANRMSLHTGKTKSMLLTTNQKRVRLHDQPLNVRLFDSNIECVSSHKLHGVTLENNLSWNNHCDDICSKIRKKLFLLRKLKCFYLSQLVCNSLTPLFSLISITVQISGTIVKIISCMISLYSRKEL